MKSFTTHTSNILKWLDKMEHDIAYGEINPVIAEVILRERNAVNRVLSEMTSEKYAADMKQGRWQQTDEPIIFSESGFLLDGQHRLRAVILSGCTITFLLAKGIKEEAQMVMDDGKGRKHGDYLHFKYQRYGSKRAAIIAIVSLLCLGTNKGLSRSVVSEIDRIYTKEISLILDHFKAKRFLDPAPILGSMAFAAKSHPNEIADFADKYFGEGDNLPEGSPILKLRNLMMSRDGANQFTKRDISNLTLLALKQHVEGIRAKSLKPAVAGYDYFAEKQIRTIISVRDLFRF